MTPIRIAILAAFVGIAAAVLVSFTSPHSPEDLPIPAASQPAPMQLAAGKRQVTKSGLTIIDIAEGSGRAAKAGDTVAVHYTGRLLNGGTKFDSSHDHPGNQPIQFPLGEGKVIPGWDEGIAGMKVGGKRQLVIPPSLAYGETGQGPIPPNATLVFDVELVGIR